MALTKKQVSTLGRAIKGYSFPAVAFDFNTGRQLVLRGYSRLEKLIRRQLLSGYINTVKDGLSNVLYWGYATSLGRQRTRVNAFRRRVTNAQLRKFRSVVRNGARMAPFEIAKIGMPQFSNMSFVSKILMFLYPKTYVTLDLHLAKLKNSRTPSLFRCLNVRKTSIPITMANQAFYYTWCRLCEDIARVYFKKGNVRAVDVERALFALIRNGKPHIAALLIARA